MRVGRVASTVRASVPNSAARPFMPRGGGGKIERRAALRMPAFGCLFGMHWFLGCCTLHAALRAVLLRSSRRGESQVNASAHSACWMLLMTIAPCGTALSQAASATGYDVE